MASEDTGSSSKPIALHIGDPVKYKPGYLQALFSRLRRNSILSWKNGNAMNSCKL